MVVWKKKKKNRILDYLVGESKCILNGVVCILCMWLGYSSLFCPNRRFPHACSILPLLWVLVEGNFVWWFWNKILLHFIQIHFLCVFCLTVIPNWVWFKQLEFKDCVTSKVDINNSLMYRPELSTNFFVCVCGCVISIHNIIISQVEFNFQMSNLAMEWITWQMNCRLVLTCSLKTAVRIWCLVVVVWGA